MKILPFGTCRILQLFENNSTFIEPIQYLNYGCFGGLNVLSLTHDCKQVNFLLNIIKNNVTINDDWCNYELFKKLSVFNQNVGDYRCNLLSKNPNYNINDSIKNINNQLNKIEYIILEVCTLKKLVINNVPLFLDINDHSNFNKISDNEFNNDFDELVKTIYDINPKIKIIFISHFIQYKGEIINERLHILNLLKENVKNYKNCYVLCPSDYINDDDLEDNRHYKPNSIYKIVNAIKNKILDIESDEIVNKMKETGILKFNLEKFLNCEQKKCLNNINICLDNMVNKIKNNDIIRIYPDNKYLYSINNYLSEPFNLNSEIFVDFFKVMLSDIITLIAQKYLENDVYIYNALFAINYNTSNERVQSQNWHRDPGGKKIIKFFIFFDEVNELNGALEYIPNTQYTSTNLLTNLFQNNGESIYPSNYNNSIEYNQFEKIQDNNKYIVSTNNFDCVSIDTSGFHRAGYVQSNQFRKYLHVLFLTKEQIINNKDPCDVYQKGFNHNQVYNIDYNNIEKTIGLDKSKFFY